MVDIAKALEKQGQNAMKGTSTGLLDDHLYMFHMPYSYTAEQIRNIRTFMFHMDGKEAPRLIMVTSSLPGEGKSLISANLAISIAKGEDQHVLLVECDLRKPAMQRLFRYTPSPGLAEILTGRASISDCLIKTPIEKLSILPSAKEPPPNPSELLESKKMKSIIKDVSRRYSDRYVILDTPPIQATVDPKILASQVEAIIMVARQRYTNEKDFKTAISSLPREKIIGTVLNAVDELPSKKYRYRKYGYRYSYNGNDD